MINANARRTPATGSRQTVPAGRSPKHPPVVAGSKHGTTWDPRNEFNDEEWQDMVANAAYYRAEARGFEGGSADEDWYEAEAEMRERFGAADSQVETVQFDRGAAANMETEGE